MKFENRGTETSEETGNRAHLELAAGEGGWNDSINRFHHWYGYSALQAQI